MAAMPSITSVSIGIVPAGSGSSGLTIPGAGHEYVSLGFADGSKMILEAGPNGFGGTGDLVEQSYGSAGYETLMQTNNINATGHAILNAYDNYAANTQDYPVAYSPDTSDGYNSNTFVTSLLQAAGITDFNINAIDWNLESVTGLNPVGADTATAANLTPMFTATDNSTTPAISPSGGGPIQTHPARVRPQI